MPHQMDFFAAPPPPIRIAIYGGTFSPPHKGHTEVARFLQAQFKFDQFRFLPNKAPVLDKAASAPLEDRMEMLQLALAPYPEFSIDRREVDRDTPSFMVETLKSLHAESPSKTAITLIIGMDSFKQFHRWREWKEIFSLCNLIVMDRPGNERAISPQLQDSLSTGEIRHITDPAELSTGKPGGFYICDAGTYDISSTRIRDSLKIPSAGGETFLSDSLSASVLDYIRAHKLFGWQPPADTSFKMHG